MGQFRNGREGGKKRRAAIAQATSFGVVSEKKRSKWSLYDQCHQMCRIAELFEKRKKMVKET